jgi:hypothetical protein
MPPAAKPPRLARAVPDFRNTLGDTVHHKKLAREAYRACRAVQPLPVAFVDRLWAGTLAATAAAPAPVQAKMYRRAETLLRLLSDWHRWPRP